MKILVAAAAVAVAACGGGKSAVIPHAAITVDGTAFELVSPAAVRMQSLTDLTATSADDMATLTISFETKAAVGPHTCKDGTLGGLFSIQWTDSSGRYATFFPAATPGNNCTFELVRNDSAVDLIAINGTLANMANDRTKTLSDGDFTAQAE